MAPATIDLPKNPNWTLLQTTLAYNAKLVEFAFINFDAAFECTQRLLSVNSASEFDEAVTNNMRGQFEALSEHVEELSAFMLPDAEDTTASFWD